MTCKRAAYLQCMKPTRDAEAIAIRRKFSFRIIWVWPYKLLGELNGGFCPFSTGAASVV
jgi:hypothetical protein